MNVKKAVIGGALIGALALGAAAASAQWRGPRPVQPGGQMGDVLALVEEQTGLSVPEIMAQLRGGATLADLIEANGGDTDAVVAAAVEAATGRIEAAAAAGRITQEQAAALLAQVEAHVTAIVSSTHSPLLGQMRYGGRMTGGRFEYGSRMAGGRLGPQALGWAGGLRADLIALVAEETGLGTSDIVAQLSAGKTLGDILRASDVDVSAFVDGAVARAETRMNAQMGLRLETLRQRLRSLLEVRAGI